MNSVVSAYERDLGHQSTDPRCIPQHLPLDCPIHDSIVYPQYSLQDHEVWSFLYARQVDSLLHKACPDFNHGVKSLGLDSSRIPSLSEISSRLYSITQWKVARVPGLLHEKDFFKLLSQRIFPSTDFIRNRNELNYTPAPDCFHDIFGHMPLLTNPDFADFYCHFGSVALKAVGIQRIKLERIHWFSVEFGMIYLSSALKIFGSGIVSSIGEVEHCFSSDVEIRPFDINLVAEQDYDVWHIQPLLFAIESFEQLKDDFMKWAVNENLV